jgi:hypothetical protein
MYVTSLLPLFQYFRQLIIAISQVNNLGTIFCDLFEQFILQCRHVILQITRNTQIVSYRKSIL